MARLLSLAGVFLSVILMAGLMPQPLQARESGGSTLPFAYPSAQATRIDPNDAPHIDGDASDPVWKRATVIDDFHQVEPEEGAKPSERTEVRVLYDENNLYFAIIAYDSNPAAIIGRIKQRDGELQRDDLVRIDIDPNLTRRNGYMFEINPLGARRDSLIQNNVDALTTWNTLWDGKARITRDGWTAEISIPFRSISYDRARTEWGFNFSRLLRRKSERIRWAAVDRTLQRFDISKEGTLKGIGGIREGLGLDVQTYAGFHVDQRWQGPQAGTRASFRPSGNIYYKITPDLTGSVNFNTDFSDAPLDQRQVNISRFSLFYPERRDFFLQDASAFEYGGQNFQKDPNAQPFFSRNIGIVNGDPVNIIAGAKLSGNLGNLGIGAMTVRTAAGAGARSQELSVMRLSLPVLDQSRVGVIFTNGDPTGASSNSLAGGDFQFHDTRLLDGDAIDADVYYQNTFSSTAGNDNSFGAVISFPNEPWKGDFRFKQVGENFTPALGFVARPGIREYIGENAFRIRPQASVIRFSEPGAWADIVTGLDNTLQSRTLGISDYTYLNSGDEILIEGWNDYEFLTQSFTLPNNIVVPAGRYSFDVAHLHVTSSPSRMISGDLDVQCCGFYGGHLLQTDLTVNFVPNETFVFSGRHIMQHISVVAGDVTVNVGSLDMAVNFTPDMQLSGQAEYDNISKDLALSMRYRWEFEPGSEFLVVMGHDATLDHLDMRSHTSNFLLRLGKLYRF